MGNFIELPIEVDPLVLLEEAFGELEELLEGWKPNLGQPEVILIQAIIYRIAAPLAQLAAESGEELFNQWGRKIVGLQAQAAQPATVKSKWTARDTAGYEIPAGTQVNVERTGSESIGFIVVNTVTIAPGASVAEDVMLEAIEPGEVGNDLGVANTVTLVDSYGWVEAIALEETSAGGQEAEEPAHYLGRLAETMQTLVEGVVTANDVRIVVLNIEGVGRVLVIDNYDYESKSTEAEKTTTVIVASTAGLALSAEKKAEILAKLEEKREVNFIFYVRDPAFTEVDVTAVVVERAGYSHAEAVAAAKATIEDFLSPATFAQDPPGDAATWGNVNLVRYQDLVTALNNTQQVDHYSELKLAKHLGTQKAEDLTLEGVGPLPKPGTITVT